MNVHAQCIFNLETLTAAENYRSERTTVVTRRPVTACVYIRATRSLVWTQMRGHASVLRHIHWARRQLQSGIFPLVASVALLITACVAFLTTVSRITADSFVKRTAAPLTTTDRTTRLTGGAGALVIRTQNIDVVFRRLDNNTSLCLSCSFDDVSAGGRGVLDRWRARG